VHNKQITERQIKGVCRLNVWKKAKVKLASKFIIDSDVNVICFTMDGAQYLIHYKN